MEKRNNWEVWHDTNWTEFELHSAVFGHLRKLLYPEYLVRGNYVFITSEEEQLRPDISIFKRIKGSPAKLILLIEIKRENSQVNKKYIENQYEKYLKLNVPIIYVEGRIGLQLISEQIKPYLI